MHSHLTLSEIITLNGDSSSPHPHLPLAFKISLRVVVMKEFRQDFDNVPKWFIFKMLFPKAPEY